MQRKKYYITLHFFIFSFLFAHSLFIYNLSSRSKGENATSLLYYLAEIVCFICLIHLVVRKKRREKRDVKNLYNNIVNLLCSILDKKSSYTLEHSKKVAEYSVILSKESGISGTDLETIKWAALLHDIGKIAVREEIIDKPSKLTSEEYNQIKSHALYSKEFLAEIFNNSESMFNIEQLTIIPEIASLHHERWDGKGYPYGLRAEEIPVICRIVSVADSWEAMTSDRPYRQALNRHQALQEIELNSGTQFDPKVVKTLINCVEKNII